MNETLATEGSALSLLARMQEARQVSAADADSKSFFPERVWKNGPTPKP